MVILISNRVVHVSEFVVGVWDGDECEISRPEIVPQSAPVCAERTGRLTCLSMNSLVSFSMCSSYRLVVMFIKPILDRPKSVSLMCPIDVMSKLKTGNKHSECNNCRMWSHA